MERGKCGLSRAVCAAGLIAEVLLFAVGHFVVWPRPDSFLRAGAVRFGLYWFVFAEIIKVMLAAPTPRSVGARAGRLLPAGASAHWRK